ncbi:MAG: histidinol-phosphatase [Bacteroidia bacterium]|nr:histidinol-phosphatase [Bacteroidia bacterium]
MRTTFLFLILCFFFFTACDKRKHEGNWYKGNLHTHTFWSDGDEYPEMVLKWYQEHGYNFVALSDHNTISNGEKWIVVPKSALYEKGFADYVNRFGADWVEYKTDTGRTQVKLKTFNQYRDKMLGENFLIIHSEEISDQFMGAPIHMNVSNIQELVVPPGGNSPTEVMQNIVDLVLEQRESTGVAMIPHVNHPNFYWAITAQDFIPLQGERFFEVYNGHPLVHNYGDSLHMGTEQMWDVINVAYAKRGQSLLYGLATDDSHSYHEFGAAFSNAGRGWIMVHATRLAR